jgi:hypothetical protein
MGLAPFHLRRYLNPLACGGQEWLSTATRTPGEVVGAAPASPHNAAPAYLPIRRRASLTPTVIELHVRIREPDTEE